MKKGSPLFRFLPAPAAACLLAGALMIHLLPGPLIRPLAAMEKRPMRMVSGDVFGIASETDPVGGIRRIGITAFGSGLAGLVILLALVHLLPRYRIRKPPETLRRSALGLTEGDSAAVREPGSGEVSELPEAFNRMTDAIRNREGRLEELAEFTELNPGLMMKVARDGRILYANQSVERKLHEVGLPPQHHELLLPDDADEVVAGILSGGEASREVRWTLGGRTIRFTTFALAREEAVVFHGVDVTDGIGVEEKLPQAQKMESPGRIAGGVAHDFNILLAGLLGYVSLLKNRGIEDPGVLKAIDAIEKAAERGPEPKGKAEAPESGKEAVPRPDRDGMPLPADDGEP